MNVSNLNLKQIEQNRNDGVKSTSNSGCETNMVFNPDIFNERLLSGDLSVLSELEKYQISSFYEVTEEYCKVTYMYNNRNYNVTVFLTPEQSQEVVDNEVVSNGTNASTGTSDVEDITSTDNVNNVEKVDDNTVNDSTSNGTSSGLIDPNDEDMWTAVFMHNTSYFDVYPWLPGSDNNNINYDLLNEDGTLNVDKLREEMDKNGWNVPLSEQIAPGLFANSAGSQAQLKVYNPETGEFIDFDAILEIYEWGGPEVCLENGVNIPSFSTPRFKNYNLKDLCVQLSSEYMQEAMKTYLSLGVTTISKGEYSNGEPKTVDKLILPPAQIPSKNDPEMLAAAQTLFGSDGNYEQIAPGLWCGNSKDFCYFWNAESKEFEYVDLTYKGKAIQATLIENGLEVSDKIGDIESQLTGFEDLQELSNIRYILNYINAPAGTIDPSQISSDYDEYIAPPKDLDFSEVKDNAPDLESFIDNNLDFILSCISGNRTRYDIYWDNTEYDIASTSNTGDALTDDLFEKIFVNEGDTTYFVANEFFYDVDYHGEPGKTYTFDPNILFSAIRVKAGISEVNAFGVEYNDLSREEQLAKVNEYLKSIGGSVDENGNYRIDLKVLLKDLCDSYTYDCDGRECSKTLNPAFEFYVTYQADMADRIEAEATSGKKYYPFTADDLDNAMDGVFLFKILNWVEPDNTLPEHEQWNIVQQNYNNEEYFANFISLYPELKFVMDRYDIKSFSDLENSGLKLSSFIQSYADPDLLEKAIDWCGFDIVSESMKEVVVFAYLQSCGEFDIFLPDSSGSNTPNTPNTSEKPDSGNNTTVNTPNTSEKPDNGNNTTVDTPTNTVEDNVDSENKTQPQVIYTFDNVKSQMEEAADELGLIKDNESGICISFDNNGTYIHIWDPKREEFVQFPLCAKDENNEIVNVFNEEGHAIIRNEQTIYYEAILEAYKNKMNFTADYPFVCEKDGKIYEYNKERGIFEEKS